MTRKMQIKTSCKPIQVFCLTTGEAFLSFQKTTFLSEKDPEKKQGVSAKF